MFRYGPAFHQGPGVFFWLVLALLVALFVLGVVAVVRIWSHPHGPFAPWHTGPPMARPGSPMVPPGPPIDPALTELRIRYARGDIDWDEYSRRAANLGYLSHPDTGPGMPTSQG